MTGRLITLDEAADTRWDVIVVGTGVGGATFGYAMARAGRRVLFCERGGAHLAFGDALTGTYPEEHIAGAMAGRDTASVKLLHRGGRDAGLVEDYSLASVRRFIPYIGSGPGGSSALYGMAMERLFPSDFEPRRHHPTATESSLPDRWPIDYAELAPWYRAAEALYRLRGTNDPLRAVLDPERQLLAPPPMSRESAWLSAHLESRGLHPYRLPMACEFVDGCQGCQGYLCPKTCKNDSAKVCLAPAMSDHGAHLVADCIVTRLESSSLAVTGVVCRNRADQVRVLRGEIVALAAGALRTPALLLRSATHDWPLGLANTSGLVGRNLMRHCIDLFAIRVPPEQGAPEDNRQKQLAFNDFYDGPDGKLGSVQSFGRLPPWEMLFASMHDDVLHSKLGFASPLLRAAKPLLRKTLGDLEEQHVVLAATLEDAPYADNMVSPARDLADDSTISLRYRLREHDMHRMTTFRRAVSDSLKPLRVRHIKMSESNQRIAHACGTCRFGNTPRDSVLDAYNRAHAIDNLFVVDASFFPSSGGTNPSLTIAANALRVADALLN